MSPMTTAAQRPALPVRVLKNLRSRGIGGTLRLLKKKAFATDKLVLA